MGLKVELLVISCIGNRISFILVPKLIIVFSESIYAIASSRRQNRLRGVIIWIVVSLVLVIGTV